MKKLYTIIIALAFSQLISAQTANWENIFLTVSGNNVLDGVEAWFMKTRCGSDDVILLRFNNTNPSPVTVTWYDAVFKQDLTWINRYQTADMKSLQIPAQTQTEGSCGNESPLLIRLNGFVSNPDDFKRYGANYFTVVIE